MTKDNNSSVKIINQHGPTGFVFFAAFIGAAIYFMQYAHNFWEVIVAILKALVWPGFVVYHGLRLLGV